MTSPVPANNSRAAVLIPPDLPLPSAEGANFFHFTVVGTEIQLLVGSINLLQLHDIRERRAGDGVIIPQITHRFALSKFGFDQLKGQIDQIAVSIGQSNVHFTQDVVEAR